MDKLLATKIGEVLAYERVGLDTIEKARESFNEIFGEGKVSEMVLASKHHAETIDSLIMDAGVNEAAISRSGEMVEKLFDMRDKNVSSSWDNLAEIGEWIGLFAGGAIVKWKMLQGYAEKAGDEGLKRLCDSSISRYKEKFDRVSELLHMAGKDFSD